MKFIQKFLFLAASVTCISLPAVAQDKWQPVKRGQQAWDALQGGTWYEIAELLTSHTKDIVDKCARVSGEFLSVDNKMIFRHKCHSKDSGATTVDHALRISESELEMKPRAKILGLWIPVPKWITQWIVIEGAAPPGGQYVVLGGPAKKGLFILSRNPTMTWQTFNTIRDQLRAKGFLVPSVHGTNLGDLYTYDNTTLTTTATSSAK